MANIVLDFLHNYQTGERRETEPANAYQYDEGHVLEAVLPEVITSCEIHYWIRGMEEADAYEPGSITPNSDGSCTVLGNIPNKYFETNGELRIYIVVTDGTASITTYEGKLHICQRSMPDDYVDDDPDNEATRVLVEARAAAATATAAAEDARESAQSARGLTEDVKQALLQIAEKVAYVDADGQDYYDALESALYPPVDLVSISAVYTQSGTVYDTDTLDSLKTDLVVTATYSDQTTETVTTYTLSGTLTVGTSTITVSYGGKTTTFTVDVTEYVPVYHTGYVEVGSPTITDNILTVADGKFIKTNELFSPGDSTWAVRCKYRRTEPLGSYTDIFGGVDSTNASARTFLFELGNSAGTDGAMFASSNGTAWDITSSQQITYLPNPTSWVWVEMSFDGSNYILKSSTDGETWTSKKTITSSVKILGGSAVGFGLKRNGYLRGEIDISTCEIYIDGTLWWKAVA